MSIMIGTLGSPVPLFLLTARGGVSQTLRGLLQLGMFDPFNVVCASMHGLFGEFWTKNVCWNPEEWVKIVVIHLAGISSNEIICSIV